MKMLMDAMENDPMFYRRNAAPEKIPPGAEELGQEDTGVKPKGRPKSKSKAKVKAKAKTAVPDNFCAQCLLLLC